MIGHACTRASQRCFFEEKEERKRRERERGGTRDIWWLIAPGLITAHETRRYAWEFVAFDDQEVGVPAPHNSALARSRARVFTLSRGSRPAARMRSAIAPRLHRVG